MFKNPFTNSTKNSIKKNILWCVYICSVIIIIISITIVIGTYWLSSERGQIYLKELIDNKFINELGYKIEFRELSFSFPLRVEVEYISLSDRDGKWSEVNKMSFNILPTFNINKHLTITNFSIDELFLYRLPNKTPNHNIETSQNIKTSILVLSINTTNISKSVSKLDRDITFSISGDIFWNGAEQSLSFKNSMLCNNLVPNLESLELLVSGVYLIEQKDLKMSFIQLLEEKLKIEGNIQLNFETQKISLDAFIKELELEKWTTEAKGNLEFNLKAIGTIKNPVIQAIGKSNNVSIFSKATPDTTTYLNASLNEKQLIGNVVVESHNALTKFDYIWLGNILSIHNINGNYLKNTVSGKLTLNTEMNFIDGNLHIKVASLDDFLGLVPGEVDGNIDILIDLSSKNAAQTINLKTKQAEVKYKTFTFSDIQIQSLYNKESWKIAIGLEGINNSLGFKINTDGDFYMNDSYGKTDKENNNLKKGKIILNNIKGFYDTYSFINIGKIKLINNNQNFSLLIPKIKIDAGDFSLSAKLQNDYLDVSAKAQNIPLKLIEQNFSDHFTEYLLKFNLLLNGKLNNPQMNLVSSIHTTKSVKNPNNDNHVINIKIKNGVINFNAQSDEQSLLYYKLQGNSSVNFNFQSPTILSIKEQDPINAEMSYNLDLLTLSKIISQDHRVKGNLTGKLSMNGTYHSPIINGAIKYKEGTYDYLPLSFRLKNINAAFVVKNNLLQISKFIAQDNKTGALKIDGSASFRNISDYIFSFKINTNRFHMLNHPSIYSELSGNLFMKGDNKSATIDGKLNNERLDIYMPDELATEIPKLNVIETISKSKRNKLVMKSKSSYPIIMNIALQAKNKVFIRGWGINAELFGKIQLSGSMDKPKFYGKLSTIHGRYQEFGKQFQLIQAELIFDGNVPPSPYLNVVGSMVKPELEIKPTLSGSITNPVLDIESSPSKPKEEILSTLLFGKDLSKINTFQAIQLANSLKKLSTKKSTSFDPLRQVRDLFGLDYISINDNNSGTSMEVQKYLADNIRFKIDQGKKSTTGKYGLEADITSNVSVENTSSTTGSNGLGLNWKYNY